MIIFVFRDLFNSAFLFSIARYKANRPIERINQGEFGKEEAIKPADALNIKPEAIQKISNKAIFLRYLQ